MDTNTLISQEVVQAMMENLADEHNMAMMQGSNGVGVKLKSHLRSSKRYDQQKLREQQQALPGNTKRVVSFSNGSHNQSISFELPDETNDFRLRDVAQLTGFSEQYILILIERHGIVQPEKSGTYGNRPTYRFSSADVNQLMRVKELSEKGKPIREIAHLMNHDAEYQQAALRLAKSLTDLLTGSSFDEENWQEVVWTLSQIPILSQQERGVLMLVEAQHKSLAHCAVELGLQSEKDVRAILESAHSKLGSTILYLLKLAAQK